MKGSVLGLVSILSVVTAYDVTTTTTSPKDQFTERSELVTKLLEKYDGKTAPVMSNGEPIENSVTIFVTSFSNFKEASMDYQINMFLRQSWVDERLAYGNMSDISEITIDPRNQDSIWTPDLYITNEKKATFHEVTVPNKLMRFNGDGRVLYSLRVSVTAACHMDLITFPLDRQVCTLEFESYGYTARDLVFKWNNDTPIDNVENIILPHFYLTEFETKDCTKTYQIGNFTCIKVEFHLWRQIGYYLIQIYVPSVLVVGLSWVNFWIDIEAVPARVSVGLLTVLTMTTQSSSSRQSMPKVSYVKAIDVWMSTCLVFVFAALLEFAVVNVYARKSKFQDSKSSSYELQSLDNPINGDVKESKPRQGRDRARDVDKKSRKLFPICFLIFNMFYWPLYAVWGLHFSHP